jgi:hypothetical protein
MEEVLRERGNLVGALDTMQYSRRLSQQLVSADDASGTERSRCTVLAIVTLGTLLCKA